MSGGAGEAGSQEGACVDTVNHTEAEMPPAQVPSPVELNFVLLSHSYSCLLKLPLKLFLLSRQPQLR